MHLLTVACLCAMKFRLSSTLPQISLQVKCLCLPCMEGRKSTLPITLQPGALVLLPLLLKLATLGRGGGSIGNLANVNCLQGAEAIADVVLGVVSPSGRLPLTFYYENYTSQVQLQSRPRSILHSLLLAEKSALQKVSSSVHACDVS